MYQLKGSIRFAEIAAPMPAVLPIRIQGEWGSLDLPGISFQWHNGFANLTQAEELLILAAGRPRLPGHGPTGDNGNLWAKRYREKGDRAADEVGGGFSAIILDLRQKRCVLFNDRFSIETLCYRFRNGELGFADAAAAVPGDRGELDPQAIYDYLYFHMIPSPATVFGDIQRLLPGETLPIDANGISAGIRWQPVFEENNRDNLDGRLQQFREIISASVEQEADGVAVACFLSGGTDSSTIAGMLTRLRGTPAPCYSIGFEAEGYDEMEYARIAARHFGLDHREYYLTANDLVEAIPRVAAAMGQPFGNSSILPAYYCALQARKDGFDRMLAGDGGDELFGGNERYARQKLFEFYHQVPKGLRDLIEPAAVDWPLFRRVPGLRQLGGYVRHSRIPMPDRVESFNLLHSLGNDAILNPTFWSRIDSGHPITLQRQTWQNADAKSLLNRFLAYDWKYTLADSDLPKVRTATQLAGVTVAYPFLSLAMTDFSLTLPPQWKLKGFKLRWFFKEALRDFLPPEILRKKKHGFGLPFGPWLLKNPRLRELVDDSLEGIADRGIVRPDFLVDLLNRRLPEGPGYYGEMVWILMMLEQWLRANAPKFRL